MCGSAPAAVTTDGKARSLRRGVPVAGTSTSRSRRLPVFWDELEPIDRNLNSGSVLCQRRLRAYYEFRDRSEPVEKVAHTSGPRRAEIRIGDSRESDTGFARRPARRPARW